MPDGQLGYGRLLPSEYVAIYKLRTQQASDDLDFIERHPILYRSHVNDRMFKRWAFIGARQVTGELAKPDKSYMQSDTDYRDCTIFDTDGNSWAATPEECIGLEASGVWDPEAMEKRIVDSFEGRINGIEVEDRGAPSSRSARRDCRHVG